MANAGEISVRFTGKDVSFSATLKKVADSIRGFAKSADQSKNAAQIAGGSLQKLAGQAKKAALAYLSLRTAQEGFQLAEQAAGFVDAARAFEQAGNSLDQFREATQGLISDAELVKKANLADTMGITGEQFKQLAKVAQSSAKITGQSFDFLFESVVVGTARQSKMILDNLGIMINVGDANERYAKTLGTTAKKLTDAEKKQAFFNAVMSSGNKVIDRASKIGESASEQFARFRAQAANLATVIGESLLPFLNSTGDAMFEIAFAAREFFKTTGSLGEAFDKADVAATKTEKLSRALAKAKSNLRNLESAINMGDQALAGFVNRFPALRGLSQEGMIGAFEMEIAGLQAELRGLQETLTPNPLNNIVPPEEVSKLKDATDLIRDLRDELESAGITGAGKTVFDLSVRQRDDLSGVGAGQRKVANELFSQLAEQAVMGAATLEEFNQAMSIAIDKQLITAERADELASVAPQVLLANDALALFAATGVLPATEAIKKLEGSATVLGNEFEKISLGELIKRTASGRSGFGDLPSLKTLGFSQKQADAIAGGLANAAEGQNVGAAIAGALGGLIGGTVGQVAGAVAPAIGEALGKILEAVSGMLQKAGQTIGRIAGGLTGGGGKIGSALKQSFQDTGALLGGVLATVLISQGPALMNPIGLAVAGLMMAALGPVVATVAPLGLSFLELAKQTESFATMQRAMAAATNSLIQAFEPFFDRLLFIPAVISLVADAAAMLVSEFMSLGSANRLLFELFKGAGLIIISVMTGFAQVWNGVIMIGQTIGATFLQLQIAALRAKLALQEMFGADAVALLGTQAEINAAVQNLDDFNDAATNAAVDLGGLQDAFTALQDLTLPAAIDLGRELGNAADTAKSFNEQLTNVPQGFKVVAARFRAIVPGLGDGPTDGGVPGDIRSSGGNIFNIEVGAIMSPNPESFIERIQDLAENAQLTRTGSPVLTALPFNNGNQ